MENMLWAMLLPLMGSYDTTKFNNLSDAKINI